MSARSRYEGPERRSYGWHLRKEINVGHLLTTLSIAAALVVTWTQFNVRMALMEDRQARQSEIDAAQDATTREALARVDAHMTNIQGQLSKLIEWQMRRYSTSPSSDSSIER